MKQSVKKIIAREIITLIVTIASIVAIWGIVLGVQSFKTGQIRTDIDTHQALLDSLNQVDFNRTLLFYFCEVEDKTFLDRLYKDYQNTYFKNTPTLSALIDTMKEYNGILMSSFAFILMNESKQPYYLRDLKYPDFEEKIKNSISIYDKTLPDQITSQIHKRKADQDFDISHIDRFWIKANNDPELVFNEMTESYKKFFDFSSTNDLVSFLKKNDDTSYRVVVSETRIDINSLKGNLKFWTKLDSIEILIYVSIGLFGLLYVLRGLWILLSWAIRNAK